MIHANKDIRLFLLSFLWVALLILPEYLQALDVSGSLPKHYVSEERDVKICLSMIVKNESRIILRCLDSAKDIVDCVVICDTGSTDNTEKVIEEYLRKNSIPGRVYHHQWRNFGYNRTLAAEAAQQTLRELGFSPTNTYLLFLDADMVLQVDQNFKKNSLIADSYLLVQRNTDLSYYNLRLAKASMPWRSEGVTHEYWTSPLPHQRETLAGMMIDDREDGGAKADKFERDIRLLKQGLQDEPDNERYMFYLAQSYKCLRQYDKAIEWYKARIAKGGWKEEIWYSKFMIAESYKEMGEEDKAVQWFLEAYQYNPARAETLHKLANYYRLNSKNDLAYIFAKQGSRIPFPKDQVLFVSYPVYDYQFDEELSIVSYYTGYKSEGLEASHRLTLKNNIPESIKTQAYRNLLYYVDNLKGVQFKPISIDLPLISEGSSLRYNPANPSIRRTKNGYEMIYRTVNYTQVGAMHYHMIDKESSDQTIRTKNFLVSLDHNFKVVSQKEIIERLPRKKNVWRALEGLEDCRIFELGGQTWFTCTTDDTGASNQVQISLCKLAAKASGNSIEVEKLIPLNGPNQKDCEKNWLPFVLDNELYLVYGYSPFTIYKPDCETGECAIHHSYVSKNDFTHFRGSAAPIEFENGYLMMVHEVSYADQRNYFHRFLTLDKNFKVTGCSKPFTLLHKGVEMCLGMTLDHSGSKLVMAVGIEDREAFVGIVDLNTIRSILEPLPQTD